MTVDRKIIDTIPDNKPPQVTFSCSANGPSSNSSFAPNTNPFSPFDDLLAGDTDAFGSCNFQFWVDRIESFHCELSGCSWESKGSFDTNQTNYQCEKIKCACIPGQFLCGEDGSVSKSKLGLFAFRPFAQRSPLFYFYFLERRHRRLSQRGSQRPRLILLFRRPRLLLLRTGHEPAHQRHFRRQIHHTRL